MTTQEQTGANNTETGQASATQETPNLNIAEGANVQEPGTNNANDKPAEGEGNNAAAEGGEKKEPAAGDKPKEGDEGKSKGAPEKYELNFGETEGSDETAPAELKEEFTTIARELNLDQEQAQKLADLGPKMQQAFLAKTVDTITKASKDWSKTSANDKEIGGGNLTTLKENLAISKAALEKFATPELKALLGENTKENPKGTGLGNHPEFIRMFLRAGKAISESKFVTGGSGNAPQPRDPANVLYGNTKKAN